ncbi:MAG: hypothetical protein Fues2KO_46700 [Fuerstiella sp.]
MRDSDMAPAVDESVSLAELKPGVESSVVRMTDVRSDEEERPGSIARIACPVSVRIRGDLWARMGDRTIATHEQVGGRSVLADSIL